jgi:hypothetical protein
VPRIELCPGLLGRPTKVHTLYMAPLPMGRITLRSVFVSVLAIGSWTSATGPASALTPAVSSREQTAPVLSAQTCNRQRIMPAVRGFFTFWDHRDKRPFGQLFEAQGILDMATKNQDTLHDQAWTDNGGRRAIVAFAVSQWRLGELFSYHGMEIYTAPPGGIGGAEVDDVFARFSDGSVQRIEEAKFNYDCSQGGFTHVVIISAGIAVKPKAHADRGQSGAHDNAAEARPLPPR